MPSYTPGPPRTVLLLLLRRHVAAWPARSEMKVPTRRWDALRTGYAKGKFLACCFGQLGHWAIGQWVGLFGGAMDFMHDFLLGILLCWGWPMYGAGEGGTRGLEGR